MIILGNFGINGAHRYLNVFVRQLLRGYKKSFNTITTNYFNPPIPTKETKQ